MNDSSDYSPNISNNVIAAVSPHLTKKQSHCYT